MMEKYIQIGHGSGGKLTHSLIKDLFYKYFENRFLAREGDSALLEAGSQKLAFTTDSYVVDPVFFPGGNIGTIAVCGTVNDLAVSGAIPRYISAAFIIEEGLAFQELESVVSAMAEEARRANVLVVTGDTKVVSKGQCDKLFINTSGIGQVEEKYAEIGVGSGIRAGDKIIINGSIARHGMAVMAARNFQGFKSDISSDCSPLNTLISDVLDTGAGIKFMRDATRGGLATVACEITRLSRYGIDIDENSVPVDENVRGMCELLGFDPFYVANEGKVVMVADAADAEKVVQTMKSHPLGRDAAVIGEVVDEHPGRAVLHTGIGGRRIMDMLAGGQLPRIC